MLGPSAGGRRFARRVAGAWVLTASLAAPGCGPTPPTPASPAASAHSASVSSVSRGSEKPSPAADPDPAAVASSTCTLTGGTRDHTVDVDGVQRSYRVVVGPDAARDAPVLFAWHGFGSDAEMMLRMVAPADHWRDAVVVAPRGLGRTFEQFGDRVAAGWQIATEELDDRDLALFDALMQAVPKTYCVDPARVYSTGFSNGGFFSHLLACHRAAVVTAAAPVGAGGPYPPKCARAVPVSITHGTADKVVPLMFAEESTRIWARRNGCGGEHGLGPGCRELTCEGAPVQVCTFSGGHRWVRGTARRIAAFLHGQRRVAAP